MPYATLQDLVTRYGRDELVAVTVLNREQDPGPDPDPDETVADQALADAAALIDSYLARRYTLPLTVDATPPKLQSAACVIARYRLHDDRASERIRQDYEDQIQWLRDLAAGRTDIPELITGGQEQVTPEVGAPDPVFTEELLGRMP